MHIPRTEYGKTIDIRLTTIGKQQVWLIEEVSKKTGLYFDDSYLNKIKTGKQSNQKIITAINEILGIEAQANNLTDQVPKDGLEKD